MNQLKLLNFHKMIANFANNLVGAFVPLLIYQATKSLPLAFVYLVSLSALRIIFAYAFKKAYNKYPQVLLLLRVIPIVLYNLFIFVMDIEGFLAIGVIGVCIFHALDSAVNNLSKEIIFNYSSLTQKSDKSIGVTRLFEQIGIIVALVVGGYLLDINKTIVLISSISIYLISVIPLVLYYIKSKHEKTFNKDATSNAVSTLKNDGIHNEECKKITKKLLFTYGLIYFSFAFLDLMQTSFSLLVFIKNGEFATAGIINAVYNCFYAIGFYVAGMINEKKDTTKLVSLFCVVIGICVILLPFIDINNAFVLVCLIYGIIGFVYPFISLFVLDRMLIKCRIMGVSNKGLFSREVGCLIAYVIGYSFGFIGLLAIFIVMSVTMIASSAVIPIGEEQTRKNLVNFLQNNEIVNSPINRKIKKTSKSK